MLLLPEVVDLSLTQKAALAGEFENLAKLGLVLEDFGAGVMVREVPALLKDAAIKKMVADLADEMAEWGATTVVEDQNQPYRGDDGVPRGRCARGGG